jgi:hypothetical protein
MKFYFPDSQDQIDPSFDFKTEDRNEHRVRQRDDLYAHEALSEPASSGILVSKAIVEGTGEAAGRYSFAQRHRLYRVGVREFFRLDSVVGPRIDTLGDCGAFTYVREDVPPVTVDEVISFYEACGFDTGVSIDHVIAGYDALHDQAHADLDTVPADWRRRQEITLSLADDFLQAHRRRRCKFEAMGVAQGWSPNSYATSVKALQKLGYKRIALGGMVTLKTPDILQVLAAVDKVRRPQTMLHLFGITRCEHVNRFSGHGVTSIDSTSPFRQAFKDERANYHTAERNYVALRVPQVDGNPSLKRLILSGAINQAIAMRLETACLRELDAFDRGRSGIDSVLNLLCEYESLCGAPRSRRHAYRETLSDAPWKTCKCKICKESGIHVVIFRGSERNKRRGFHNLWSFNQRLQRQLLKAGKPSS